MASRKTITKTKIEKVTTIKPRRVDRQTEGTQISAIRGNNTLPSQQSSSLYAPVAINLQQPSSRLLQPSFSNVASSSHVQAPSSRLQVPSGVQRLNTSRMPTPIASSTLSGVPRQSLRPPSAPGKLSATMTKKTTAGGRTVEQKKSVTKTTMPRSSRAGPSGQIAALAAAPQPMYVPPGHYMIPTKRGVTVNQSGQRVVLSSPPELRRMLDQKPPISVQTFTNVAEPGTYRSPRALRAHSAYQDIEAGNVSVAPRTPRQFGPTTHEDSYFLPADRSYMNYTASSFDDIGSDYEDEPQTLQEIVHRQLETSYNNENPDRRLEVSGIKTRSTAPPFIETQNGAIQATHQVNIEQTVSRLPEYEIIGRHTTSVEADRYGGARQVEMDIQRLEPGGLNETHSGESGMPAKEVVSVTSSITIAPGIMSQYHKTVYQKVNPEEEEPVDLDPDTVQQLIDEENRDVELMNSLAPLDVKGSGTDVFELKKRVQKSKLSPKHVQDLERSIVHPPIKPREDGRPQELHPEMMAALMHSEEQGLGLDSEPANVCNYLFPKDGDELVMEYSSAAQPPLQNVVVPVAMPSQLHTSAVTPEMQMVAGATLQSQSRQPAGDVYTQALLKQQTRPRAPKKTLRPFPKEYPIYLNKEKPPWEIDDIQPMIDLVGASPSITMTSFVESQEGEEVEKDETEGLEYELIPQPPKHMSRIQLRGSQKPSWFPGYIVALPGNLKIAKSLSEVLPAAWKAVQPDIFAEDSFMMV